MPDEKRRATTARGREWEAFSLCVFEHIEHYTVPQYGDAPDDQATEFTVRDCMVQVKRYANRAGKVEIKRQVEDMKKVAHYACIAWAKLLQEE